MSKMTMADCQKVYERHQAAVPEPWATWGNTQKLSREQVGMLAYFGLVDYANLKTLTRVGAIAKTKEAKPAFLPIKRHVRWRDLEDGCVLRYCGHEGGYYSYHEGDGLLVLGELYTVKRDKYGITIPYSKVSRHGIHEGHWGWGPSKGVECWEFVSNPNFVHGLDKRKTYFLKDQDKYNGTFRGPIKVLSEYAMGTCKPTYDSASPSNRYAYTDRYCWLPVEDLTTEEPKPAEPTYRVYDGEVKASDKVWWWGNRGPTQDEARHSLANIKHYPNVYSIAEPPFTMTKLTNGQTIKTYDYMQAPYGDYKAYQAAHPLNKTSRAEVLPPSHWKVGDIVTPNAGSITLDHGKEYVIEAFVGGNTPLDGRKVRVKGYSYHCPEGYHSSNNLTWVRRPAVEDIPPSEWRKGDVLRCIDNKGAPTYYEVGKEYVIYSVAKPSIHGATLIECEGVLAGMFCERFEFVRRPIPEVRLAC